jgi:hypothetical protein
MEDSSDSERDDDYSSSCQSDTEDDEDDYESGAVSNDVISLESSFEHITLEELTARQIPFPSDQEVVSLPASMDTPFRFGWDIDAIEVVGPPATIAPLIGACGVLVKARADR